MEIHKLKEKTHIESAALNYTDNRALGAIYLLAFVGFVFTRKNFGVRTMKLQNILFTFSVLMLWAALADWITKLPLIRAELDYSSFKLFAVAYLALSIYHLVKAYMASQKIPHLYTRHIGDSYIASIAKLDLPFFKKDMLRINAFAEPIVFFVIAQIVGRTIAPNLGNFLMIVAVAMCVFGILIINNHKKLLWDQNDAMFLGELTQDNMKDAKPGSRKKNVTRANRAAVSRPVQKPNSE